MIGFDRTVKSAIQKISPGFSVKTEWKKGKKSSVKTASKFTLKLDTGMQMHEIDKEQQNWIE